jgi:hypothetical protein
LQAPPARHEFARNDNRFKAITESSLAREYPAAVFGALRFGGDFPHRVIVGDLDALLSPKDLPAERCRSFNQPEKNNRSPDLF